MEKTMNLNFVGERVCKRGRENDGYGVKSNQFVGFS